MFIIEQNPILKKQEVSEKSNKSNKDILLKGMFLIFSLKLLSKYIN